MTSNLRDFLNKNRDLLENDKIDELIAEASGYSPYYTELIELLDDCGTFDDFDEFRNRFVKQLNDRTRKIEKQYEVAGFCVDLSARSYATFDECTIEGIKKAKTTTLTILPIATGDVIELPDDWRYTLYVDAYECKVSFNNGVMDSATYRATPPRFSFNFVHILKPDVMKGYLDDYCTRYEEFCKQIANFYDSCMKSFEWYDTAKKYAEDIAAELKVRAAEYFDIDPVVNRLGNACNIYTGLKNTKDNIRILVPFDEDPSKFDAQKALNDCLAKIKRLKKTYERNTEKQAEVEANRPANYREITRRDITAVLKELGIATSGTCYTNKHPNVTTYKYAFTIVSQADCKRIEDKLREIGADVDSVYCTVSGAGWRSYTSLFIKIRN